MVDLNVTGAFAPLAIPETGLVTARLQVKQRFVGDVAAGRVYITYTFKAAGATLTQYFLLNSLFLTFTGSATTWALYVADGDWNDEMPAGSNPTLTGGTLIATDQAFIINPQERHMPIYLGKPTQAGQGRIYIVFGANTNLEVYTVRLSALLLSKPLSVPPVP